MEQRGEGFAAVGNRVRQRDAPIGLALRCPDLVMPPYARAGRLVLGRGAVFTTFGQLLGICSQSAGTGLNERRITLRPRIQRVSVWLAGADGASAQY